MHEELNYICWFEGQDEGDGKEIKAPNLEAAARKAVDIWRHEKFRELSGGTVTVYVKDERGDVSKVNVKGYGGGILRDASL